MAKAVRAEGCDVTCKSITETKVDDLLEADCIAFGSPVYYGTMAAEVKKLFDESVSKHGGLDGKVGAAFASAGVFGGGMETTVSDILHAMLIHGMIIQGDPKGSHYGVVCVGKPDDKAQEECARKGKRLAKLVKKLTG
jgi:NAD(P)H dehydrogenase (quinone)